MKLINERKISANEYDCHMYDNLDWTYIYEMKDGIIDDLSEFDKTGFTSYYDVIKSLKSK